MGSQPYSPGDHTLEFDIRGIPRTCLLHVPPSRKPPMPLVMMLHGRGGTGPRAAEETGWSDTADARGFVVAYPDALPPDPSKAPKFLTNPAAWDDFSIQGVHPRDPEDVRFIQELLKQLDDSGLVDPEQRYLTGFSNGAGFAFRLAVELSGEFAAIAPVAGHCNTSSRKLREPIPTCIIIGTEDPLIPLNGGIVRSPWGTLEMRPSVEATIYRWAKMLGVPTRPHESMELNGYRTELYTAGKDVDMVATYIAGLGHHWPGGRGVLGTKLGGPIVNTVNANRLIWEFFSWRPM